MFAIYAGSIAGGEGRRNQDRVATLEQDAMVFAVIADGAGGMGGGERAAQLAVEFCVDSASRNFPDSEEACRNLVRDADQYVHQGADGGEATLVVAVRTVESVFGASVGDSVAWVVQSSALSADLTCGQLRRPFVGSGSAIAKSFLLDPACGNLVLATDGLYKYLEFDQLMRALGVSSPSEAGRLAFALLAERYKVIPDDASIIVCGTAVST